MKTDPALPAARFCAVIPAYNAAGTIGECVQRTRCHLSRVVVVDDGPHDGTARLAEEHGAVVVRIAENRGKGWALRCGFQKLLDQPWEGVMTLDGDLQHDPDDIPAIIAAWIARLLSIASLPPRRITTLPDRRQSAAASAVTSGRLSWMMPITPSGTHDPRNACRRCQHYGLSGAQQKNTDQRRKELFNLYIRRHDRINTWDLVDRSAPWVVGSYLMDKPSKVCTNWRVPKRCLNAGLPS